MSGRTFAFLSLSSDIDAVDMYSAQVRSFSSPPFFTKHNEQPLVPGRTYRSGSLRGAVFVTDPGESRMLLGSSAGPSQRSSGFVIVSPTTFQLGTNDIRPGNSLPKDLTQPPSKLYPFSMYRCLIISVFLSTIPWFVSALSLAILAFPRQDAESPLLAYAIFLLVYTLSVLYLHISVPWRALGWLPWRTKEHRYLIFFIIATIMLILLWDLALISPFFSGLFKQSHFYASVLVLSEVLSAISLALLAVSWWKKSNEIGHSSAHKIASLERESRIFGAIDGLKLDHQRSSDSTPLPLDYPENDVERLEGLEEIDSNPNPFSDEYQARSSDSSLPPERVAEEIVESSVTELANPFLASSLDPRPSLTLAEERPDSLVLRGSFLSEGISDLADYETLPHEHSSPESPPVRPGLEDHRPASAVEVSEPPTPQDENEGWTGTVRMRHDTLESNATYATLPSYRSRASAGDLLESEPPQIPPLPSFRPLPSAPSPGFDVGISRQLSASTTRSYETVPSYRSS